MHKSTNMSSSNVGGMNSKDKNLPFYEPPPRKTSVDIINEARLAIRESSVADNTFGTTLKPLQTQRPFTPREKDRLLFGSTRKNKANRPPSSFSLRYLQNEAENTIIENNKPSISTVAGSVAAAAAVTAPNPISIANINQQQSKITKYRKESNANSIKTNRSNSIPEINESKIFNLNVREPKIKLPSLDLLKPLQKKKLYKNTYSLDNLPEEHESAEQSLETRNAFSSPQERTDHNDNIRTDTPFGRPSKQQNLSKCLVLEPQNLAKIFDNKEIIKNSETLFIKTDLRHSNNSSNKKKLINDKNDLVDIEDYNDNKKTFDAIIEKLNKENVNNDNYVIDLLNDLYDCMASENMLNGKITSKCKITILKSLYKHVESQNDKLLLTIARIILALKVTGNNLSGVCKLIFKVSKNDKNDQLFLQKNLLELFIDALGRSSPLDDTEACVYGYGSIKFLTMNSKLLQTILSLGILPLMVLHIKIINNAKLEKNSIPEQSNHVLFQLTGAFRNLASDDEMHENFVTSQAVYQLCQAMDLFASDIDIVSNISRTLSTISTHDGCCETIANYGGINKIFVCLFKKYPGNEEIIVRLAYIVGNLVANFDNTRITFYNENDSLTSLLELWSIYLERTLKNCSLSIDKDQDLANNAEDVMIKLIRIVANMAINPDIGKLMNETYGKKLIDEFLKVLISNPFKKNEELVLSVLSTLNNLSFYYTADFDNDILHVKQVEIIEAIIEYTTSSNKECAVEAMRILGNLSRSKVARNYISESNLFKTLLDILHREDILLLRTTTGVFVNLMADQKNRITFRDNDGVIKLIRILNNYGQLDWSLSMLVCQIIWNYCIDTSNMYELITDEEIQQLMAILIDYLDEERLFGSMCEEEQDLFTHEYLIWEEFANVATNLLEKIEQFLDTLEHLPEEVVKTKDSSTNISFSSW